MRGTSQEEQESLMLFKLLRFMGPIRKVVFNGYQALDSKLEYQAKTINLNEPLTYNTIGYLCGDYQKLKIKIGQEEPECEFLAPKFLRKLKIEFDGSTGKESV